MICPALVRSAKPEPPCRSALVIGAVFLGAMWDRQKAVEIFTDAGFGTVEVHEVGHDIQNCYYVCKL
jgi:hypothetical protein